MDLYNQILGLPGTLTATNVKQYHQSDYTNNKKDDKTHQTQPNS